MAALAVAPSYAPITLPSVVGLAIYLGIFFAILLWILSGFDWFNRLRSGPGAKKPMTVFIVALISAFIGAIVGPLFWLMQPHDDETRHDLVGTLVPRLRVPLAVGERPDVDWFIKNSAPHALNVIGASAEICVRDAADKDFTAEQERHLKLAPFHGLSSTITPDDEFGFNVVRNKTLEKGEHDQIMARRKVLCLVGGVLYEDSGGQLRASRFCSFYDANANRFMSAPPKFNTIGALEEWNRIRIPRQPTLVLDDYEMLQFSDGLEIDFNIRFKNTGGLSANLIKSVGNSNYGFVREENDLAIEKSLGSMSELPPSHSDAVSGLATLTVKPSDRRVAKKEFLDEVAAGTKAFFMWGRLEYTDEDGGSYWTNYCLRYDGKKFCRHGNFNLHGRR
jgi:hypothetical protein